MILLMPIERLGSALHGANPKRKTPRAQIKGAPRESNLSCKKL
jgi:hypothetical protein